MPRNRKKKPNSNYLDLHGIFHKDVELLVENHILLHKTPFKIITGNSNKMKNICFKVLEKHNFKYSDGNIFNLGCIEVLA